MRAQFAFCRRAAIGTSGVSSGVSSVISSGFKFFSAALTFGASLSSATSVVTLSAALFVTSIATCFATSLVPSIALATPIDLKPHGAPTPAPSSIKALAEKEVVHPQTGAAAARASAAGTVPDGASTVTNSNQPVVFPDFANVNNGSSSSPQDQRKTLSKVCRREGHSYKPGDVMYASCSSQNEVDHSAPRASHGKSHGASTGADSSAF